jgi:CBS domain-containing protein
MTVSPDDDVAVVAMRMIALGIRHLPVLDASGNTIGMLSARALSAALEGPRDAVTNDAGS